MIRREKSRIDVVCQNGDCRFFHKEDGKDIIRRGMTHSGAHVFFCKHCNKYFDENKGTIFYRKRVLPHKITKLCHLLTKRCNVRELSQHVGVNKNTVVSWLDDFAVHAVQVNGLLKDKLKLKSPEIDVVWRTIRLNKRKLSPEARLGLEKVQP